LSCVAINGPLEFVLFSDAISQLRDTDSQRRRVRATLPPRPQLGDLESAVGLGAGSLPQMP